MIDNVNSTFYTESMNLYKYKAVDKKNNIVKGKVRGVDTEDAALQIVSCGLEVKELTIIQSTHTSQSKRRISNNKSVFLKLDDKILFTSQLETILKSGISILAALEHTQSYSPKLKIRTICSDLIHSIKNGSTLYEALNTYYPDTFGNTFISLVKAGEQSGNLELVLGRLVELLKKQQEIKKQIISASIYPCVLIVLMIGVFAIFGFVIYPKAFTFFADSGATPPAFAQSLFDAFNFLRAQRLQTVSVIVCLFLGFKLAMKNIIFKINFDKFILKIPLISTLVTYANLANAMALLHIGYASGVTIINCLELAMRSVNNTIIKSSFVRMITLLNEGKSLSEVFSQNPIMLPELISMVSAGDLSGNLTQMFKDCTDILDKKLDEIITRLAKIFEPLTILILGIVVGIFAIAIVQLTTSMVKTLF